MSAPSRAEAWEIAGRRRLVHIWPESGQARPPSAVFIGGVGWVDVRPEDEPLSEPPPFRGGGHGPTSHHGLQ
jgi:hypothetical protein